MIFKMRDMLLNSLINMPNQLNRYRFDYPFTVDAKTTIHIFTRISAKSSVIHERSTFTVNNLGEAFKCN